MLSNKPYLIRAFYDWIVDSRCTPLLVIDATAPNCNVPQEYVENGEIILNVSPDAIRDLKINASLVEFRASFSGIAYNISAPIRAVLAVYAEENGQGMFFDLEQEEGEEGASEIQTTSEEGAQGTERKKTHLKLVE